MWLAKLKINGLRWLLEALFVFAALAYAMYCRTQWLEMGIEYDDYIEAQEAMVLERIAKNQLATVKKQAAMDKLKAKHAKTLEYINDLTDANTESHAALTIERTNVSVLQSAIKTSFSTRSGADSATSDGACADRVPGRRFRRVVIDCGKTTIMLKELNEWKRQTCEETDGVVCAKK